MRYYNDDKTLREIRAAYYTDVRDCAAEIMQLEDDEQHERLCEEADGVVTYTADAELILLLSDNAYAAEDEMGVEEVKSYTVEQKAYFAFQADVRQLLNNEYFIAEQAEKAKEA